MWGRGIQRLAAGIVAVAAAASGADARPVARFASEGAPAEAPRGFMEMCARDPKLCGLDQSAGGAHGAAAVADTTASAGTSDIPGGPSPFAFAPGTPPFLVPIALAAMRSAVAGPPAMASTGGTPTLSPAPAAASPPPPVIVDRAGHRLLRRINALVNWHVRQVSDHVQFGENEVWRPSGIGKGAAGDCEDLALEKRIVLEREGIPAGALRLAIVYSRKAGLHTVLVARTTRGDLVLDSRTSAIVPWDQTPYIWLRLQSSEDPRRWYGARGGETIATAVGDRRSLPIS